MNNNCDCYKKTEKVRMDSGKYENVEMYDSTHYTFPFLKGQWINAIPKGKKRKQRFFLAFKYCSICGKEINNGIINFEYLEEVNL